MWGRRKKVHVQILHKFHLSLKCISWEGKAHSCWAYVWHEVMPQIPTSKTKGRDSLIPVQYALLRQFSANSWVGSYSDFAPRWDLSTAWDVKYPHSAFFSHKNMWVFSNKDTWWARTRKLNIWCVLHLVVGGSHQVQEENAMQILTFSYTDCQKKKLILSGLLRIPSIILPNICIEMFSLMPCLAMLIISKWFCTCFMIFYFSW